MNEAIEKLWEVVAAEPDVYVTREQFLKNLEGYEVTPEYFEGEMIGVVLNKGPAFHFTTFGKPWRADKAMLAKWPGSLIDRYGYAETFTPIEDTRQQRFNRRVGFVETHRDAQYVYYRIERKLPCQQSQ